MLIKAILEIVEGHAVGGLIPFSKDNEATIDNSLNITNIIAVVIEMVVNDVEEFVLNFLLPFLQCGLIHCLLFLASGSLKHLLDAGS